MERLLTQPKQQGRSSKVMHCLTYGLCSAMHPACCLHDDRTGCCGHVAELDSGELLFVFRRGDAWASVGTAFATVAAEGQRILWQPLSVRGDTPAAIAASLPSPADQPAPHVETDKGRSGAVPAARSSNGSTASQARPAAASQNGSIASQAKPANASQNGSTHPMAELKQEQRQQRQPEAAAVATEEAPKASIPAQRSRVQGRATALSPARSEHAQNGSQPLQAIAARQSESRASQAAQGAAPAVTDLSKSHPAESSTAQLELASQPRTSTVIATESQPAHASAAQLSAPSAALPDAEPGTPQPDDARSSSGASRREARQASGREYVESIIAGAEATWREAGLARSGADAGGTDPREPSLAAQKAAVTAAKVRHTNVPPAVAASIDNSSVRLSLRARHEEWLARLCLCIQNTACSLEPEYLQRSCLIAGGGQHVEATAGDGDGPACRQPAARGEAGDGWRCLERGSDKNGRRCQSGGGGGVRRAAGSETAGLAGDDHQHVQAPRLGVRGSADAAGGGWSVAGSKAPRAPAGTVAGTRRCVA